MKGKYIILPGIAVLLLETAAAQGPGYVSVGDYTGTDNERINAAIAAAVATDHKTVFFPNGTYALRSGLGLNQGTNTELHLLGESRDGVFIIPDIPYLEANYNGGDWENGGARIAHMINLSSVSVFNSVDVSIQNMTVDMRHQRVMGDPVTYNVVGHGIRIGTGWVTGQFTVNQVTIRNTQGYGVGIQDRDGHPKNNITLTNMLIERTGSDGVDTKEASGDGNRNLVIRDVSINEVGFLDTGAAPALDLRYRDVTIENVNIVSKSNQGINAGQSTTGINFRPWDNGPGTGIAGATVTNAYIRGTAVGMRIHSDDTAPTPHENIAISDFRIQGQKGAGIDILGTNHSGHTISDGFVDPAFGGAAVVANGQAVVTNVIAGRWDPALTPLTETTFESNVSLAGTTYSPAWVGMVGSEQVSINPTAPGAGPFVFDVGNTGVMRIDFDTSFNAMDKLIVDGTLNLDGELRISTIGGAPSTAGTYRIFEADAITGSFDSITLPAVPGLAWVTDNLTTNGTISLQQPPNTIIPVNSGSFGGTTPIPASYTQSVTVGAGSDMLIVMTSSELGSGGMTVTYGGVPMNLAVGNKANSAIWYLDLSTPGISGTDVVVDLSNSGTRNGFAAGWVSIDANLEPDQSIVLHSTGTSASQSNTVDLTTTVETFNVVNFNGNNTSKAITVDSPNPTVIYTDNNIGSAEGAAAYAAAVAAGSHTYQWTLAGLAPPASDYRRIDAAAFAIVGNDFSDWIAGYPGVGDQTGLNDDPDGDGDPNGVEAWFGTNPAESSGGLANLATDGITTTFTHPQNETPPADVNGFYEWSPNLVDWYDCDGVDGPPTGQTVTVSSSTMDTTTTVTATASEPMDGLFLRAGVVLQN